MLNVNRKYGLDGRENISESCRKTLSSIDETSSTTQKQKKLQNH
jgi:hypothetical protein